MLASLFFIGVQLTEQDIRVSALDDDDRVYWYYLLFNAQGTAYILYHLNFSCIFNQCETELLVNIRSIQKE